MSIQWMNKVWSHSNKSGATLLVLLAIADHANDDGVCWPSIATLATKARISERQAKRVIAALEADGDIEVMRGDGRTHTSTYRLKNDNLTPISRAEKGDICDIKGDKKRERVTFATVKGDIAMSPDPSLEPPIEPSGNHHHAAAPHGDEIAAVYAAYMDNISATIAPIVSEKLADLVDEVGARSVIHGITIAAQNNKRNYRYVETVARNYANGTAPQFSQTNGNTKVERSMAAVDRVFGHLEKRGIIT